jgi:phospholipid/cholesterol/gamma-HCH transport system substrate-binding protein
MNRRPSREIAAGLVALLGLVCLGGVLVVAAGGPGFLAPRRSIDVLFRDGHSIRIGCPVRIAGLDAGRVAAGELADGQLHARVRISVPTDLAAKLRQDARICIETGLTGQSYVNIINSGKSEVPLVQGQVLQGVETSFFDPILEQVGMGPVERNHLSHTIAEIRETVDTLGPRLRSILSSLDDTALVVRQTVEEARPKLASTATHLEQLAQKLDDPKVSQLIAELQQLTADVDALLEEYRPKLSATLASAESITRQVDQVLASEAPKVSRMLTDLQATRARADKVLGHAEVVAEQGASIMTKNRGDIERILANVNQASDYGVKLVQKLFANPFYLSPFYKPTPADIHAEEVYSASSDFLRGAKELSDAVKSLQAMQGRTMTAQEQEAYNRLFRRAWDVLGPMKTSQQQLSEALRNQQMR